MYLHWGTKFGKRHPHQTAPKDLGHKGQALGRPLGPTALLRPGAGGCPQQLPKVPNPMYLHWGTKFGKRHPHQTAPKDLGHKGQALGRPLGPTALLRQVQGAAHSSYQRCRTPCICIGGPSSVNPHPHQTCTKGPGTQGAGPGKTVRANRTAAHRCRGLPTAVTKGAEPHVFALGDQVR